jgi:hypothetical protein
MRYVYRDVEVSFWVNGVDSYNVVKKLKQLFGETSVYGFDIGHGLSLELKKHFRT